MKVYKALRVLERNKNKETPTFSRAIEKLIRYFSKAFPQNCGIEGNLNDLNISSHGVSTASNFYRSSTFQSEFSDFAEEIKEINKMASSEGKSNYHQKFNFIDSKTSNDSNSVKDGIMDSKTELNASSMNQRKMSNEKSPSSGTNFLHPGYDSSANNKDKYNQNGTLIAYKDNSS